MKGNCDHGPTARRMAIATCSSTPVLSPHRSVNVAAPPGVRRSPPSLDLDERGTQKVDSINSLSDEEERLHIAQETNTSSRTSREREREEDGRGELPEDSGGHPQGEGGRRDRRVEEAERARTSCTTRPPCSLVASLLLVSAVGLYAVYADRRHKAFDVARAADRVAERPPPPPPPTPAESDPRK
ncbi:hypothetical protein NL676_035090 [Syzygium grande]|nr:hypothetical protein NL676_035090 [Syzygium grande]